MTKTEDRISLSTGNWIAIVSLLAVVLGSLVSGWADIKADAAVTRSRIDQLSSDVTDLKATIKDRR